MRVEYTFVILFFGCYRRYIKKSLKFRGFTPIEL